MNILLRKDTWLKGGTDIEFSLDFTRAFLAEDEVISQSPAVYQRAATLSARETFL